MELVSVACPMLITLPDGTPDSEVGKQRKGSLLASRSSRSMAHKSQFSGWYYCTRADRASVVVRSKTVQ